MNTENNNNLEGVLRRIQKLLAMANDGRGDANEAASAANMAEKLMRKYQLDNADLIAAQLKKGDGLAFAHVFANMKRDDPKRPVPAKNPLWGQHLAVAIGRLNDCEARLGWANDKFGKYAPCITFYGFEGDVQVCAYLFDYIVGALIDACKVYNKSQDRGLYGKSGSEAFRKGFTASITARIYTMRQEKEVDASASRALVLVKRDAIVEKFGDFKYKEGGNQTVRDLGAFSAGREKARTVDLNRRGVGHTSSASATLALK